MSSDEDKDAAVERLGLFLDMLFDLLRIVVERRKKMEREEVILEEQTRLHEEQYPGTEIEDWFFTDHFTFEWM
jgi:hypothetical protein